MSSRRFIGVLITGVLICLLPLYAGATQQTVAIALHGGAGTIERDRMSMTTEEAYRTFLDQAISDGYQRLRAGEDGLDVVVAIIQAMEDSPLFNAGKGSVYTWEGRHELDASIMHGERLAAGAVAGVTTVQSPIALARAVMEQSPHVMLASEGAEQFAKEQGVPQVSPDYFATERRRKALEAYKVRKQAGLAPVAEHKFGTVGVVVLDSKGNLVAGTSTGGMTGKRWGRVGDAPIIGAGTFADNRSCAVSATGHGEFFIRHTVARDICARVQFAGQGLKRAAETVILDELVTAGGDGGVIAVDAEGAIAMVFNTPGMYRASVDGAGVKRIGLFGNEP